MLFLFLQRLLFLASVCGVMQSNIAFGIDAVGGVWSGAKDLSQQEITELGGQWFYRADEFVPPSQLDSLFSQNSVTTKLSWQGRAEGPYGKGTYALILKDVPKGRFGVGVVGIGSAYHMMIVQRDHNVIVAELSLGDLSSGQKPARPAIDPKTLYFNSEGSDYILLFHIENRAIRHGGFWETPTFAYEEVLRSFGEGQRSLNLAEVVTAMIMGLYCLSLFLRRNEDKASLFLAIYCFYYAFMRNYLAINSPTIDWDTATSQNFSVWLAVRYSNLTVIPLLGYLFVIRAFPRYAHRLRDRLVLTSSIVLTLLLVALPTTTITENILLFQLNSLAVLLLQVMNVIKATRDGDRAARVSAYGYSAIFFAALFDILMITFQVEVVRVYRYGVLVFLYCQTQVTGIRFAEAFRKAAHLSRALQLEVDRQTRDIKAILKSIPLGIFTIRAYDGKTDDQFSSFLQKILQRQAIEGETLQSLLLDDSDLSADRKSQVEEAIAASLGEDSIAFELNEGNLAHEMQLRTADGKIKFLEIEWAPMLDKDGSTEKLLIALRDVSELRELQRSKEAKETDFRMVLEILNLPEDRFQRFMRSTEILIDENRMIIELTKVPTADAVKRLFVNMHTIKGSARTYLLKALSDLSHQVERSYVGLLKDTRLWNRTNLSKELESIALVLRQYQTLARDRLGWNLTEREVRIPKILIEKALAQLALVNPEANAQKTALQEARSILVKQGSARISGIVEEIHDGLASMAKDLGRLMPDITVEDGSIWLYDEASDMLHSCLVHLFRNAIDHGIERTEERLFKGKPAKGRIVIQASIADGFLAIHFFDDGAGLNLEKIRMKALNLGLLQDDEQDDQALKIASMILEPGFSTKDEISEISGRGVGMGAVKDYLESKGGQLLIVLGPWSDEQRVPFELVIQLPERYCLEVASFKTQAELLPASA